MVWRILAFLLLAVHVSGVAQDTKIEDVPEKSDFRELRSQLKKNDVNAIEQSILNNDFIVFSSFLHPKIAKGEVKNIFDSIQRALGEQHWHLITHYAGEQSLTVVERGYKGKENTILVDQSIGNKLITCDFTYTYFVKDSSLVINGLGVVGANVGFNVVKVPGELGKYEGICYKLWHSENATYEQLRSLEKELMICFDSLKKYDYELVTRSELSRGSAVYYNNLAWTLLTKKDFKGALKSSQRALELNPDLDEAKAKLATVYLLLNDFKKAKPIYISLKNKKSEDGTPFKKVFADDIIRLERIGITHPDFQKVNSLLNDE